MSGLVLKRKSGHTRRVLQRLDPDPVVPVDPTVIVYWDGLEAQIVEGGAYAWMAHLSAPIPGARAFIPVTLTGTADPAELTVRDFAEFAPGQTSVLFGPITSATAAAGSSTTAIFTLDPSGAVIEPEPGQEPPGLILETDTTVGPDTFTLTILDNVPPAVPTIDMGGAPGLTGPESNITINLSVVLSGVSTTDVVARVAVTGSTGVAGVNYVFEPQTVTFTLAGQQSGILTQRVPFQILDDGVSLPNIVTTLTATLVSGSATVGANNILAVTVVESIQPGGKTKEREIQWVTVNETISPGAFKLLEARVVDSGDKSPFAFVQPVEIPITRSGVGNEEWAIDWQGNTPGFLSFAADELRRRIVLRAPDDLDGDDEIITFTIEAP